MNELIPSTLIERCLYFPSLVVLLTIVLELTCWKDVRRFLGAGSDGDAVGNNDNDEQDKAKKRRKNRSLYLSALVANVVNDVFLGAATYYIAVRYFAHYPGSLSTIQEQIIACLGVVIIEAILYYAIHMSFHEVKGFYWMHRYHHKFNDIVLPSTANAVSVWEFAFAYMLPLVMGVAMTGADEISAVSGSAIVGITNLLIHTPWMENVKYHWIFVSATDHMNHHRKLKGNYGAPVIHMDRILEYSFGFDSSSEKKVV